MMQHNAIITLLEITTTDNCITRLTEHISITIIPKHVKLFYDESTLSYKNYGTYTSICSVRIISQHGQNIYARDYTIITY